MKAIHDRSGPVRLSFPLHFFLLAVAFIGVALAQSPNATISGLVLDPANRVIVGADLVIVNDATGVKYSTKTNDEGIYVLPNLPPGAYRIQVSKVGFKAIIKPDIVLNVQDALSINFTLPLGAFSETLTVEGGAPLVSTESSSVSTVIDRQFVENLPLNGRSFNTLLQLTPGVIIAPASYSSPGQFSVAGQRTDANTFTVDGVSANFGITAGQGASASGTGGIQAFSALGGTSSLVSVEALQEFRIETSSFSPEFGKTPGGQVILNTRSGTNDLHGGIYEYFRNTVMDANDWFANRAGNGRAPEQHNDFGGFLGGSLRRDKTFFFFSYEAARLRLPQTSVIQVPSTYARENAATQLQPYLKAYPQPNGEVVAGSYSTPFSGTYSNTATLNAASIRIDHRFNDRYSIFGRYNYAPSQTTSRVYSLSDIQTTDANTQTLTLGLNMAPGSVISNTLRGNYSTQLGSIVFGMDSFGGAVPVNPGLLLGALPLGENEAGFLAFDATDYFLGPNSKNRTKQMDITDDLSISSGKHLIRLGGDYRGIFLNIHRASHDFYTTTPSVENFVTVGTADLVAATLAPARLLAQSASLYAQDAWKATARLTVTYGLRWELSPAPSPLGSTTLASWANVNSSASLTLAPAGTPSWSTTLGNFAPRLGVAYSLTPNGGFVLKGAVGIFYDLGVSSAAILANYYPNTAFRFSPGVNVPVTDTTPYLPSLSNQPPYPDGTYGFVPNLKLPRSYQWNLALERAFAGRQAVSFTYVGQAGRELLRQEALYQPNGNFLGEFLLTGNSARSNYNSFQLQYRRPLAGRLQALVNYSWSHSLDNSSSDVVAGFSGTVISAARDYTSSDFDIRHSLSGAVTCELPGYGKSGPLSAVTRDWSVEGLVVARTGFPFNAQVYASSPDPNGYVAARPDLIPGQALWVDDPPAPGTKILNINAFSIPSTIRQGTEGRNDIPGFGLTQVDLSLRRKFGINERINLVFRADAFNVLNHPNFSNPGGFIEYGTLQLQSHQMLNQGLGGLNPLFQEGGPRSLQLSLKLLF
jgi:hypothetical protein